MAGLFVGTQLISCERSSEQDRPRDFVRLMNVGQALVENRESAKAVQVLTRALEADPNSAPAWRNLARAHLITKKPEDAQAAVEALTRAREVEADSAASDYLMGLAHLRRERYAEALPFFEQAVRLDPHTAALRYQLGRALEAAGRHDDAHRQFLETIRLDPMHRFAYYRLAAQARARGDREAILRYTLEFQRLKKIFGEQPEAVLEQCVHTRPDPVGRELAGAIHQSPIVTETAESAHAPCAVSCSPSRAEGWTRLIVGAEDRPVPEMPLHGAPRSLVA